MRIEPEHIKQIQSAFHNMNSKEDLLNLLNYSKKLIFGEKTIPFHIKVLTYYSNPSIAVKRYTSFSIKKKSGKERQIHAPVKGLKAIQRSLNLILQVVFMPHPSATGFIPEKSIVDNASLHVGKHYVYNIDLKDFFPSIDQARIWKCLQLQPFCLTKESGRLALANIIAALCCTPMEVDRINAEGRWEKVIRNVLPQGAPTSPLMTNVVCQKLDYLLTAVARRFGLTYSRYADDITFSSKHNVFKNEKEGLFYNEGKFQLELNKIITSQGFTINQDKTRLQKQGYRQEVTGLVVNDKTNVKSRYVKTLRSWLYLWETYGYEKAQTYFINDYFKDKGHVKNGVPNMINVISGKLDYLKMVKGIEDGAYNGLKRRFDSLIAIEKEASTADVEKKSEEENIPVSSSFSPGTITSNQVELTLRPIGPKESRKLLVDKNIPEGIELPYQEVFINRKMSLVFHERRLHFPNHLSNLLKVFSDNNNPLKYTTHSWEFGKFESYENFMDQINSEWNRIKKDIENLNSRLAAKISNFLFNKNLGIKNEGAKYYNSWGENKLKFGWSSPQIASYCKNTQNDPFNFPIPLDIKKKESLNDLNYFKDYVDIFKNEIEVREDGNKLEKIFFNLWSSDLSYDFNLNLENLKGVSFYTDVQWLKESLKIILRSFRQRPEFNEIKITLNRDYSKKIIVLSLMQIGSICNRSIEDEKISTAQRGDFSTLFKNFKNLCDWSICSEFPDKNFYKINYLTSQKDMPKAERIEVCEGFTHILTFFI